MKQINIQEIIYGLIMSGLVTITSIIFFNILDPTTIIIIFTGSFIINSIFSWYMSLIVSRPRITREIDEIEHPVTQIENTLHIFNIQRHFGKKYNDKFVERCNCGSKMFRIYNEETEKGSHIQFICMKCNNKSSGIEFDWKVK